MTEIDRILKDQREQIEALTIRAEKAEASVKGGRDYLMRMALACVESYRKNIQDIENDTCDWSMVSLVKPKTEEEKAELIRRLHDMVFFWETEAARYAEQIRSMT